MTSKLHLRRAVTSDVTAVVQLVRAYANEVHDRGSGITPEALLDDGFGTVLEFAVAEAASGDLVGFAAWEKTYDLVTGTRGGALLGIYVDSSVRGTGTGHALLACVAHEVRAFGGDFLLGFAERQGQVVLEGALTRLLVSSGHEQAKLLEAADLNANEAQSVTLSLRPRA